MNNNQLITKKYDSMPRLEQYIVALSLITDH